MLGTGFQHARERGPTVAQLKHPGVIHIAFADVRRLGVGRPVPRVAEPEVLARSVRCRPKRPTHVG
jgi:hypothetical protein